MTLRITVAPGLAPLAAVLAGELAVPLDDPFCQEVVAVPAAGTRTWLTSKLGERLGGTGGHAPDGIVANVDLVFPAELVNRAMGMHKPGGAWSTDRLTWAVYEVLQEHGAELGIAADAVRSRAIADLFDRYGLHRSVMVRQWERNVDVDASGAPIPEHLRWQPTLWRLLLDRLGWPSDAAAIGLALDELRLGRRPEQGVLPPRVFLFGVTGLPQPHLDVLAALAAQTDVHVLAPVTSLPVWERVGSVARRHEGGPILRAADPSVDVARHQLAATWGRAPRESLLLLASSAAANQAVVTAVGGRPQPNASQTLLDRIKHDMSADEPAPGTPEPGAPDARMVLDPSDPSVRWHRCHGPGRQVEVVRDAIVRLLDERTDGGAPRYQPRDMSILCPDLTTYAPLLEAAFEGDPAHGVPAVPLRVADRSLRQDDQLLDTVGALLELLDGRFRASSVLAFAARPPVRRRFSLGPEHLGVLADWVDATNVRWGLDASSHERFGVPVEVGAHTWEDGLDQLLVGSVMADGSGRLGPGDTVPFTGIEGDAVELVGALADLVHQLGLAASRLATPQTVASWCNAVSDAAAALCAVPDGDSWQWRDLHRLLDAFEQEARIGDTASAALVPHTDLAALLSARLVGRPGRARFGTGTVTVSSLNARRGVPSPVTCLLGIDGDLAGGVPIAPDDLIAATPFVGDNDPRSELRAQLLDAVLATGERLVICTTGRDVRTNAEVPPSVPVAELVDLVDATAVCADGSAASRAISVDHPRQAWSDRNFRPRALGVDGAWSFDRGALVAARIRRQQHPAPPFVEGSLDETPILRVTLAALQQALLQPVRTLLYDRLGVYVGQADDSVQDLVPVAVDKGLGRRLAESLLQECMACDDMWDVAVRASWERAQRRSGGVPPMALGDAAIVDCNQRVEALLHALAAELGPATLFAPQPLSLTVAIDGRLVDADIDGLRGTVLLDITAAKVSIKRSLVAWLKLALLTVHAPDTDWSALLIGSDEKDAHDAAVTRIRMRSPEHAQRALGVVVDLHDRARRSVVPFYPETCHALLVDGRVAAEKAWKQPMAQGETWGEATDRWLVFAVGDLDFDDMYDEPTPDDERGEGWGANHSRVAQWAERIWGTFADTTEVVE